ncbi:MAG: DUF4197 domain-containing protein [gamma proteobacterium endosymbiont of Lamellibrachia anaximandri]|nr:DUF4197 domain-containing protein [gamma proteobacterium endosymbiont of Lamellibrachia anaximandri]
MKKREFTRLLAAAVILTVLASSAQGDWKSIFKQFVESDNIETATQSVLSNSDMVSGLKEALANGVETAINRLGKTDGFLADELVRIAMPDSLKTIESIARKTGQGHYVDEFVTTLNRAAEQAVPEASAILGDSIRELSVADAKSILNGSDDAATQYFRKSSEAQLEEKFRPIVERATNSAGVTSAYKSLLGQAGGMFGGFFNTDSLDLDRYVTDRTMDGLFKYIAIQEKQIRENPAARTTDLLKKVFSE